jgi:hypothetical protein
LEELMREFHALCVKISRNEGFPKNVFLIFRAFPQKNQLASAVLNDFQNSVDGICHLFKNVRPTRKIKLKQTNV